MEITNLARDIAERLERDKPYPVDSALAHLTSDTFAELVQIVLDNVESLGGFDLSAYEDDDEDDMWNDDEDEDDRDDESDRWGDDDELPAEDEE